jgi:hypothetical protein
MRIGSRVVGGGVVDDEERAARSDRLRQPPRQRLVRRVAEDDI